MTALWPNVELLAAAAHRCGPLNGRPRVRWAVREVAQQFRLVLSRALLREPRRQDLGEDRQLQFDAAIWATEPLRFRVEEALSLTKGAMAPWSIDRPQHGNLPTL
jgi:hypothetical protein